jgi:formate hydrogenlyase transcriptional activator
MQDANSADVAHRLAERIKELTALRQAARILADGTPTIAELLDRICQLLPPAMQFPDVTEASIGLGDVVARTAGFGGFPWRLRSVFRTRDGGEGYLEVVYRDERPASDEGPFLAEERHLLDALAEMLQSALNHRLVEDRIRLLLNATSAVTSELDLGNLLHAISKLLREDIRHHFASVILWDEHEGVLRRHALVFAAGTGVIRDGVPVSTDRSPAVMAYRQRKTLVMRWSEIAELGEPAVGIMAAEGLRSVCCVPLQTRRACHGALTVAKPEDVAFSADEVSLLEQIALPLAVAIENALAYQQISLLRDRLTEEKVYLEDEVTRQHEFKEIVGQSRALASVLDQVRTVAPTDATVLLLGETGTGKELVARAIHETSRRRGRSFIRVNSAALPANLVESELFGYEKGAFSGAVSAKAGRLELAHHGTLFLDEVGELPLEVQPKLLRAVQEHEIERLGGTSPRRVDFRLIAATNRDLEEMVRHGAFRRDLFYRLNVFPIRIPPLRERPEDIPFLVRHFVDVFSRELGRHITTIPARTMEALQRWPWPGNIRELQNVIERAVIVSTGPALEVPDALVQAKAGAADPTGDRPEPSMPLRFSDGEREIIMQALRQARGVIGGPGGAAARLGLRRTTLQSKMRKLGIVRPTF